MARRLFALALGLAALACPLQADTATEGGPLGVATPLFPKDNWWNQDISQAPVDPRSATFVSFAGGASRGLHPDFGGCADTPCGVSIYGFPYVVVSGVQTSDLRTVLFQYASESDGVDHQNGDTPYPFYPIPDAAIAGTHWIEGGEAGGENQNGGDRHMLIVDQDHNWLYELYSLVWDNSQSSWTAGSGAFFDMNTDNRRPEGWTSADAAGLQILPGLVRYDEVYGSGPINHAFRVTVHDTNGHVYPASHTACNSCPTSAPPMGARFRLKASKDISGFPAEMQRIFQAMKTYGLIVADNGSDMYVSGTFDTNWDNDILNPAFASLKASDFEVIELGWQPPTSVLSVADAAPVVQGSGPAQFTVSLSPAFSLPVTVRYATVAGTALAGADYVPVSGTLTFAPGVTTRTVSVPIVREALYELDETFTLNLSQPWNASLSQATGTGTIVSAAAPPAVSVADFTGLEPATGLHNFLFPVTLSKVSGAEATVDYETADGTAFAGSDYLATSGTLTFPPGVLRQDIAIPVLGNITPESAKTFTVVLQNPVASTVLRGAATGTIKNQNTLPFLSIEDGSVSESAAPTTATLQVSLSAASSSTVKVAYVTAAGTGLPGSDYTSRAGILTFAPGATTANVGIPILPDSRFQKNRVFLVNLYSPINAKLLRKTAQVAILGAADPCLPVLAMPITLSSPGSYCLARTVSTPVANGAAISIAADGVTLNLQGFTLLGTAGLASEAYGIASEGHVDLTVENGTVEGFLGGVFLRQAPPYTSPQQLLVQNVKALDNRWVGIWADGEGNSITSCTVSYTGGATSFGPNHDTIAIAAVGPNSSVSSNTVIGTRPVGLGMGFDVALSGADNASIQQNKVSAYETLKTTGIDIDASSAVSVQNNTLSQLDFGIVFSGGSTGTASGNTMTLVKVPQVGP